MSSELFSTCAYRFRRCGSASAPTYSGSTLSIRPSGGTYIRAPK